MNHADALAAVGERQLRYHDDSHQYWLGAERCRSATSIAKIPTDPYAINQWRGRMIGRGFALDPTLIEDMAASWDNDRKQNEIVDRATEVARADEKARRGTQLHAATERGDLGQPIITSQQARDDTVWKRTLEIYGIEIDSRWVERIVLYPQHLIAGRFDRIALYGGRHVLADIKTGWNAVRYPHETTVQLAIYLNAPLVAADATFDGSVEVVDRWATLPDDLDRDHAYVLKMPTEADAEHGLLFRYDMAEGTVAARMAVWARHFQLNDRLCSAVEPLLRPARDPARQDVLRRWIDALADEDRAELRRRWDVDALGSVAAAMSVVQLDAAETLLREIDPFHATRPAPSISDTWVAKLTGHGEGGTGSSPAPLPDKPDEGDEIPAEDAGEIIARYHRLDNEAKLWIARLMLDAHYGGVTFNLMELPTRRRANLLIGLCDLCIHGIGDDYNAVAAALAAHDVDQNDGGVRAGILLGTLDADGASRFATWVVGLIEGSVVYDPHTNRLVHTSTNGEIHAHPSQPADDPVSQAADDR